MEEHFKKATARSYTFGFASCIILTLTAYFLVFYRLLTGYALILTLSGLAVIQAIVQLVFFLYLGKERKPRINLLTFLFMALVLVVIVGGSLWIMYSLNERTMMTHPKSPTE